MKAKIEFQKRGNNMEQGKSRLMSAKEACTYLGLGRNRGVEFVKSIGAEVAIGRRRLYDKVVIDRYLDKQMQEIK